MMKEIMIRMGLDSRPVTKALRSIKSQFTQWGAEVKKFFTTDIARIISGGAMMAGVKKLLDHFEALEDRAKQLGVSVEFLQGAASVAYKAGSSEEQLGKALEILTRNLGEVRDGSAEAQKKLERAGLTLKDMLAMNAEQALFKISDNLKNTGSQAERVSIAFDAMGRSGTSLVTMLSQGSENLHRQSQSEAKLTQAEIGRLMEAQSTLKTTMNHLMIGGGWLVSLIGSYYAFIGKLSTLPSMGFRNFKGAADEAKRQKELLELKKQTAKVDAENAAQAEIDRRKAAENDKKREDMRARWLKEGEKHHRDAIGRQDKLREDSLRRQRDILKDIAGIEGSIGDTKKRLEDAGRFDPNLQDVAEGFSGSAWKAQRMMNLETWAKENRADGRFKLAESQESEYKRLEDELRKEGFLPASERQVLEEELAQMNSKLEKLTSLAQTEGLLIRPTNSR